MIKSFKCKESERLFNDRFSKKFEGISRVAKRKLEMLDAATHLIDLRSPPGNRLEALSGERAEQYSIRVDSQWRICFRWAGNAACDVEIVDYH